MQRIQWTCQPCIAAGAFQIYSDTISLTPSDSRGVRGIAACKTDPLSRRLNFTSTMVCQTCMDLCIFASARQPDQIWIPQMISVSWTLVTVQTDNLFVGTVIAVQKTSNLWNSYFVNTHATSVNKVVTFFTADNYGLRIGLLELQTVADCTMSWSVNLVLDSPSSAPPGGMSDNHQMRCRKAPSHAVTRRLVIRLAWARRTRYTMVP